MFKILLLWLGGVFLFIAMEDQFNPLPEVSDLKRFEGVVKEAKYLGKSRRGFTTYITLSNNHQEIIFKTYGGSDIVNWLNQRLNKPVVVLWRDELSLIHFGYLPKMWSLEVGGEAYFHYSHHHEIDKSMKSFYNSVAIFTLLFLGYFLMSNYSAYRKNRK